MATATYSSIKWVRCRLFPFCQHICRAVWNKRFLSKIQLKLAGTTPYCHWKTSNYRRHKHGGSVTALSAFKVCLRSSLSFWSIYYKRKKINDNKKISQEKNIITFFIVEIRQKFKQIWIGYGKILMEILTIEAYTSSLPSLPNLKK